MQFSTFSTENRARCESEEGFAHKLDDWDMNKWMVAACGELGEAANKMKKLNRVGETKKFNKGKTEEQLMGDLLLELGDAVIYIDLLAQRLGFDLEYVVRAAFNQKSIEIGCSHYLV